ncbi:flavin reductase family protein [Aliiroseovarius crassostreae]|uniref:flavin reductase family protein n=1 Tax=Aliiroseovarius crassostreae TaxID=154981 RepID=UPI002205EADC|nr:flavin reductase family protein [Aliiroseovarius crassostreae]UWP93603.1 flavin reductase family protein [Aliiroseovarius crassostreae]
MKSFNPGPEHAAELRGVLGTFPTGVTVVTTSAPIAGKRQPVGMTVNSFTSVSLDPPLVLWCPALVSARHDVFVAAEHFAIHILAETQRELAQHFARNGDDFTRAPHQIDDHGVPHLEGCTARLDCVTERVMDGGDHSIILGRVLRASHDMSASLAFRAGKFGAFREGG